jgi:hypothetical protein
MKRMVRALSSFQRTYMACAYQMTGSCTSATAGTSESRFLRSTASTSRKSQAVATIFSAFCLTSSIVPTISRGKMAPSTATGTLSGYPRKESGDKVLKSREAVSRTTFSPDPQQRFLHVRDRRHQRILILDGKTLEILDSFGGGVGDQPGQFYILNDMATDSHGNFYTAETNQNRRAQTFVFKGMVSAPAK